MVGMKLPVTVVSGYLGAGKTTLINRLLAEDHGLDLLVLVNDFGAINVDANLIAQTGANSIALTNGCICCSLDTDLALALRDAATRNPRPDHVIIEASGIADPASIANVIQGDADLAYAGIVTLVDALNVDTLLTDPDLAEPVRQQIASADLVILSNCERPDPAQSQRLVDLGSRPPIVLGDEEMAPLLFDLVALPNRRGAAPHPGYVTWQHESDQICDRRALGDKLAERPEGLYRLKGTVLTSGGAYELHVVGRHVEARRTEAGRTVLVGLGLQDRITREDIENWWGT